MSVRVVPQGNQWVVRAFGTVVSNHRLKHRAEERGRREARKRGTTLVIHGQRGKIQQQIGRRR